MGLKKFEKDMNIIAALDDEPNDVGGLSASQLKEKFDQSGCEIKQYINETLLPALEAESAAASLGVRMPSSSGIEGPGTIQEAIDSLSAVAMNGGAVPSGGAAGQILAKSDGEDHRLKWIDADAEAFGSYPKEKILSATTKTLFGLGADAVPNDVFDFVGKYISAAPKIATGSYIGTGVSTQSEPITLKFGFAPKFVFIASDNYQIWDDSDAHSNKFAMQIWIAGISSYKFYDYNTNSYRYFSSDNNGLSFYEVTGDGFWSTYSLNRADHAYHYFAVG